MIKAIIFDLWETLGTKNIGVSNTLREHFAIPKTDDFPVRYESSIQLKAWKTQEEMAANFLTSFNLPVSKSNLSFVINTLQEGLRRATLYLGMRQLLETLHKKYKLALLSNTTLFESEIAKKWEIDTLFYAQVYSWQIASLKPAKKNFDVVCGKLSVNPSECLFIDDGEKNVKAAQSYGLKAIQYRSIEDLKKDLTTFSILP